MEQSPFFLVELLHGHYESDLVPLWFFQESERKMKEKQLEDELMKKRDAERKEKEEQQRMLEAELAKERERIRQLQQEQLKQKFDYEKLDFEGEDNKSPSPPPASKGKY